VTINLFALTVVIVVAGRWSQDKQIDTNLVIGGLLAAVMLTALETANPKMGQTFAFLLLLAAVYKNVPRLAYANAKRVGGKTA